MDVSEEHALLQAAPVLHEGAQERAVYLPGAGPWYDAQSGALVKPDKQGALKLPVTMDDVPSYLRGGHILPLRVRSLTCGRRWHCSCSCLLYSLSAGANKEHTSSWCQ